MNINSKIIVLICIFVVLSGFASALPQVLKAFVKSAVVPGWGELSNGSKLGYPFIANEVALWSMYFYFSNEATLNEDAAFDYAVRFGGVNPEGNYDDDYFQHLSKFNSYGFEPGGFNEDIQRTAISKYPGDSAAQQTYIEENMYTDIYAWQWSTRQQRSDYTKLRNDYSHNNDYAKTVTGVIVVNHLISAINSVRIAVKKERGITFDVRLNQDMIPIINAQLRF
ncbi:MAG: hypothetical protein K8S56_10730 [Candidatus Cloacimonetes bacterium]|nr:hypothetical protein [Candidatus Cloacimonadota bacterium]